MKDSFPHLRESLDRLPPEPGVYKMKNASGKILYIGKAKSLKNRVRSYFQPSAIHSPRIALMVTKVDSIDLIVTASEVEALILEDNLIKKERPPYNIDLKDDKNYPYLKLTMAELYPRLVLVRRVVKDGSTYFGPYASAKSLRSTLKFIHKIFPIRQSKDKLDGAFKRRACLNHQMKRCLAPCAGKVDPAAYRKIVEEVALFLKGNNKALLDTLRKRMIESANRELFEQAARYRDQIDALRTINQRQSASRTSLADMDIIAVCEKEGKGAILIVMVRAGKINAERSFMFSRLDRLDRAEAIAAFIRQFYSNGIEIPPTIVTQEPPDAPEALRQWLCVKRGGRLRIVTPVKGKNKKLLELAERNAKIRLTDNLDTQRTRAMALDDLKKILHLGKAPAFIEGCDISNTSGLLSVGSVVVFKNAVPSKKDYRKYKIKSVDGPDDYLSIAEVIKRRYSRLVTEKTPFADLLMIDGGKGHVKSALAVFRKIGVDPPPIVGIAKGKERNNTGSDQFYLPGDPAPVNVPASSPGRALLQRVRDEAHRFAITYHRKLRGKKTVTSALDSIPGVGPKRKKALLKKFGSVKRIREADVEDLREALSIPEKVARLIHESL